MRPSGVLESHLHCWQHMQQMRHMINMRYIINMICLKRSTLINQSKPRIGNLALHNTLNSVKQTKQYVTPICKRTRELDLTVLSMVSRMGQANLKYVCKSLPGKWEGETFTALARTVNDSGQSNFEARTVGNCRCFSVIY